MPFGLVRFGVAPDHEDTKAVSSRFERLASDHRVTLLLHAPVGGPHGVPLAQLRLRYHATVLATGAPNERPLRVPGSSLRNVFSSRQFVEWYNGHPNSHALPVSLASPTTALVVGAGNVAIDVARMLLSPVATLARTDIAERALTELARSTISQVVLLSRRGPAQSSATPIELREVCSLPGVAVSCDGGALDAERFSAADSAELAASRPRRRAVEEMRKAVDRSAEQRGGGEQHTKTLRLLFRRSPAALLPSQLDAAAVGAAALTVNALTGPAGAQAAVADASAPPETLSVGLVVSALGAIGAQCDDAPFDRATHTIPHSLGAVFGSGPGLYCVGWAKRGASGTIGTNLACASETVDTIAAHAAEGKLPEPVDAGGVDAIAAMVSAAGGAPLRLAAWRAIDAAECEAGAAAGKPREKAATVEEMLRLAERGEGAYG